MKNFNTAEEQKAFEDGVKYAKGYIAFCMRNYIKDLLKKPCHGTCEFQAEVIDFIVGKSQYISNKANVTFDEISEKILGNVPNQNKKNVQKQLEKLEDNFWEYLSYWNERYYRNEFADVVELLEI